MRAGKAGKLVDGREGNPRRVDGAVPAIDADLLAAIRQAAVINVTAYELVPAAIARRQCSRLVRAVSELGALACGETCPTSWFREDFLFIQAFFETESAVRHEKRS